MRCGLRVVGLIIWLLAAFGCSAVGTSTGNPSAPKAFPAGLAVASPFETVSADAAALALNQSTPFVKGYEDATDEIEAVLNGTTLEACLFDPELFLRMDHDADCYGPVVAYENHPDAGFEPDDGQLPPGDVGLWMETSPADGHACAAAQLNARMEGARDKSLVSLMGLASLVCTANTNGIALPSNATQDLTAEMNALGVADTTFSAASITHSAVSGSDEWSYALDLEYSPSATHRIVVAMTHIPGASAGEFRGRLSYRVNNTTGGVGNCPGSDITSNGSLLYDSAGTTSLGLEVRQADFCGRDVDGTTDGLVDPSQKLNIVSNPDGWGNNFSILTADFDPQTMAGDFAYSWQAGPMDGNTRVFNIHTEAASSGPIPDGKAFFGYGSDIAATDGGASRIGGFICNWAGPGNSHTLRNAAQYQEVSFDPSTGKYQSVDADIAYAPTNSCDYTAGSGFRYDRDGNGTIDPEVSVTNDLIDLLDADADGVFDAFEAAGFVLPVAPSNL